MEKESLSPRKDNCSTVPTAINSPASEAEDSFQKRAPRKRSSKLVIKEIELFSEEKALEDEIRLEEPINQIANNIIYNEPQSVIEEDIITLNEGMVHVRFMPAEIHHIDQSIHQEYEFELDLLFPELNPLELPCRPD